MSIPQSISGLQLWFDANDPNSYTLSGSNITQLNDKSGNGNNTTGYSGTQPTFLTNTINGLPVFNMSSAGGFYGNMTNTTTTMTVFMIVIMTNIGINYRRLIDFTDGVAGDNGGSVTKAVITFSPIQLYRANGAGGGSVNSGISTVNTAYLVSCYFDNINGYLGVNGTYYTPFAVSGNFNINKYGIGLNFNNNTVYGGCQYGEVIVYNTALSTLDRQTVEGYLAWKWGMNASLPTNHPYKSYAPISDPSWILDISSNRFNQTYMQNFLDISGNLIIRNGSLTIPNGNVSIFGNTIISGNTFTNTQNITINSGGGSNGIIGNTLNVNSNAIIGGNLFTNYNSQFTNTNISVNGDARFNGKFLNTAKSNNSTLSDANINSGVFLNGGRILNGNSTVSIPLNYSNTAIVSANNVNSSSMYLQLPLPVNTTGNCNVAMGFYALNPNTTGCCNTAIGSSAVRGGGSYNTGVGYYSADWKMSFNTGIGAYSCGTYMPNGYNNTLIGAFTIANSSNNSTAIGYNTNTTAHNQIVFGRTSEIGYTSGRVTIGTISTSSTYKLNVGGSSGSYFNGNISANNIYINGGQNLFQLLKSINNGFVINATYDGNYTSGAYFSINGFQQDLSSINSNVIGCNSCIAYYYYISCKTNPTAISSPSISIQNNTSDMGGSPISIITNQLTYSGALISNNNISGSLNIVSYSNSLNVLFNSDTAGGTFWKVSILCQYI